MRWIYNLVFAALAVLLLASDFATAESDEPIIPRVDSIYAHEATVSWTDSSNKNVRSYIIQYAILAYNANSNKIFLTSPKAKTVSLTQNPSLKLKNLQATTRYVVKVLRNYRNGSNEHHDVYQYFNTTNQEPGIFSISVESLACSNATLSLTDSRYKQVGYYKVYYTIRNRPTTTKIKRVPRFTSSHGNFTLYELGPNITTYVVEVQTIDKFGNQFGNIARLNFTTANALSLRVEIVDSNEAALSIIDEYPTHRDKYEVYYGIKIDKTWMRPKMFKVSRSSLDSGVVKIKNLSANTSYVVGVHKINTNFTAFTNFTTLESGASQPNYLAGMLDKLGVDIWNEVDNAFMTEEDETFEAINEIFKKNTEYKESDSDTNHVYKYIFFNRDTSSIP